MLWNNENNLMSFHVKITEKGNLNFITKEENIEVIIDNNDIEKIIVANKLGKTIVKKEDRIHRTIGEENFKRDVYHYLIKGGPTKELRLGITRHNGKGTWSSLPHDFELNLEKGFEEVFFYLLKGGTKRAIQVGIGMWPNGDHVNDVWFVRDRTLSSIPMGYHPVVGEVGVQVSYVWAYLAKKERWEKLDIKEV